MQCKIPSKQIQNTQSNKCFFMLNLTLFKNETLCSSLKDIKIKASLYKKIYFVQELKKSATRDQNGYALAHRLYYLQHAGHCPICIQVCLSHLHTGVLANFCYDVFNFALYMLSSYSSKSTLPTGRGLQTNLDSFLYSSITK